MKKILAALLCVGMLLSLVACASSEQTTAPSVEASGFKGLSESVVSALDKMGYTEEKWNALSTQEQQAILTVVYAMLRGDGTDTSKPDNSGEHTLKDVEGQGRYLVTVADNRMENYFELYYRNGHLVKIHASVSEGGVEEPQSITVTGDEVQEFDLYAIDYTAGATAVVEALEEQGYTRVFIAKP